MIDEKKSKDMLITDISKLGFEWDDRISQYGLIKGINYYRIHFPSIILIGMNNIVDNLTMLIHSKFDEGGNLKRAQEIIGIGNIIKFLNKEFIYDIRKNKINRLLNDKE
jgi:hypothetical protein